MIRSYPNSALVSYSSRGKDDAFSVAANKQVAIYNARAFNNSGGAIDVGICRKHLSSLWQVWRMSTGGTVFTDITSSVQAGTASNIFTGTNNDGFVVQSDRRFNVVGFTISTNGAGGVFTYSYWNGSAYTSLTTLSVPADYNTAADTWVAFRAPSDWVVGASASTVNQAKYALKVTSTTGPGGAVAINKMWVGEFLEQYSGVSNNSAIQISFPETKPFLLNGGEALFPYFGTANAANAFGVYYSVI